MKAEKKIEDYQLVVDREELEELKRKAKAFDDGNIELTIWSASFNQAIDWYSYAGEKEAIKALIFRLNAAEMRAGAKDDTITKMGVKMTELRIELQQKTEYIEKYKSMGFWGRLFLE